MIDYAFDIPNGEEPPGERPWVQVTWMGAPFPVEVRLAMREDGGNVVCTGLRLGPADPDLDQQFRVTARNLREIPLNEILIGALRLSLLHGQVGFAQTDPEEVSAIQRALGDLRRPVGMAEALLGRHATPYRAPHLRPGRKGWPAEHFEAIAKAYNEIAAHNQRNPMAELAESQGRSLPQVRRWVQKAQEMGIPVNRRQRRPRATTPHRVTQIANLRAALFVKGVSEKDALAWLEREHHYSAPRANVFETTPELISYLLDHLEELPDIDLPVHIDPATGEVVEGPEPAPSKDETKERS